MRLANVSLCGLSRQAVCLINLGVGWCGVSVDLVYRSEYLMNRLSELNSLGNTNQTDKAFSRFAQGGWGRLVGADFREAVCGK